MSYLMLIYGYCILNTKAVLTGELPCFVKFS